VINETGALGNTFLLDERSMRATSTKRIRIKSIKEDGKTRTLYHELPTSGAFKQYVDKEKTAANIAKELIGNKISKAVEWDKLNAMSYSDIIEDGSLFFFSTELGLDRSGLLSLCPTVLTAISVWVNMHDTEEKAKNNLFKTIKQSIDVIFRIIYRDNEQVSNDSTKPVFDASPFDWESFTAGMDGRSYLDSISWAVPVFLRILTLRYKDRNEYVFPEYRDRARFLSKWCLDYLNAATLWGKDSVKDVDDRPVGWSFTRLKESTGGGRSLYFTYAASTIYLSFFAEYEKIISILRIADRYQNELSISDDYWEDNFKGLKSVLDELEKSATAKDSNEDDDANQQLELVTTIKRLLNDAGDEILIGDMIQDLMFFNNKMKITNISNEGGAIAKLKWTLEIIAEKIWEYHSPKLENSFMYDDFDCTVASDEAIENSGQTNALFTGLLQIGIILNAAYDIKIRETHGQKAYESMQNTMLIHVQRAQRYFDKLEDAGRSFGVESLVLQFAERFEDTESKYIADRLRKHSIRVCSLTPMLLKTNNLLSEYIVQYPQKQMGESLKRIGEKRYLDDSGAPHFFWETDNYHAISNYYYVGAIFDFYRYQETYEQQYIKRYDEMVQDLSDDLDFTDSVKRRYQEIEEEKTKLKDEYAKTIKTLEDKLAVAEEEVRKNEIGENLRRNIDKVIEYSDFFRSKEFLRTVLTGLRQHLAEELAARYESLNPQEKLKNDDEKTKVSEYIEKLRTPISTEDEDQDLFHILQALSVDIILPSAIEARGNNTYVTIGKDWEDVHYVEGTYEGSVDLIKNKKVNKVFEVMQSRIDLKKSK